MEAGCRSGTPAWQAKWRDDEVGHGHNIGQDRTADRGANDNFPGHGYWPGLDWLGRSAGVGHLRVKASGGRRPAQAQAPRVAGDGRVDRLLSEMTLDEKLTLLEGAQEAASTNQFTAGYLPGIPRLGIPSLRLADGPPGVATRQPSTGMTGTMGVAATFSQRDAYLNGMVIGRDARALGVDVVLEPFVNIDRDPIWSRAFNTFGEDPLLTGQTGAGEISGIQGQGTMAMVKHFIAYDGGNNVVLDSADAA